MVALRTVIATSLGVISLIVVSSVASAQHGSSQAGLSRTRRLAAVGRLPSPAEVIVEHIVNYHRHGIPRPKAGAAVAVDCRWDVPPSLGAGAAVLQIGLATPELHDLTHARRLNLAVVVDCSSSMAELDKMSRVKAALRRFTEKLRPTDRIAIVTYSTEARVALASGPFGDGARVRAVVERLAPESATNLHAGLMLGYRVVSRHCDAEATNRVILLTDGIANTGVTDTEQIAADSARMNAEHIDLSTIGVGVNLNHELLRRLAKRGRGLFHFVADEEDLAKVFDREIQSLIGTVARDVELQVSHDPGIEIERIYGYAPTRREDGWRRFRLDDFNYGLTNVVLLKVRVAADRPWNDRSETPQRSAAVRVRLSYDDPDCPGSRIVIERATHFPGPPAIGDRGDHEVRKNFAIAVMARALRTMAERAEARRYGDAERRLGLALDLARRYYPNTTDADLLRTRRMLERYRNVLQARIERFRDL